MKIPKKVTPAKRQANQKNAAQSTGPKTPRGKLFASRNSVTHAIFAPDALLTGESVKQFKEHRSQLISAKCPIGADELFQVDIMARADWQLARLYRAEDGEIAKQLSDHEVAGMTASVHTAQYNQAGADLAKLQEIEAQIDSEGLVSKQNVDWLRTLRYGEALQQFLVTIDLVKSSETRKTLRRNSGTPAEADGPRPTSFGSTAELDREGEQNFTRALLEGGIERLRTAIREEQLRHSEFLLLRVAAERDALLVPKDAALDRFMRYDNHLLRKRSNAELALERMHDFAAGRKCRRRPRGFNRLRSAPTICELGRVDRFTTEGGSNRRTRSVSRKKWTLYTPPVRHVLARRSQSTHFQFRAFRVSGKIGPLALLENHAKI